MKPKPPKAGRTTTRLQQVPAKSSSICARVVEAAIPYIEVCVNEAVTEASVESVFERVRTSLLRHRTKRVLVDVRQGSVNLSISDMLTLTKLVAGAFANTVDRLAFVVRPQDIPAEKFLEPSLTHRGLPTVVTAEMEEAVYWVTASLRPRR